VPKELRGRTLTLKAVVDFGPFEVQVKPVTFTAQ